MRDAYAYANTSRPPFICASLPAMSAPTLPIAVTSKDPEKKDEKPADETKAKTSEEVKDGEELVRLCIHNTNYCC